MTKVVSWNAFHFHWKIRLNCNNLHTKFNTAYIYREHRFFCSLVKCCVLALPDLKAISNDEFWSKNQQKKRSWKLNAHKYTQHLVYWMKYLTTFFQFSSRDFLRLVHAVHLNGAV